jgi:hypothetical protein
MKEANVEQVIINENNVHERVWKRLIAHSMIIDAEKTVYRDCTLFYFFFCSSFALRSLLAEGTDIEISIIIISYYKFLTIGVLLYFFEFYVLAAKGLFP